jgi:hypothetical protein
MFAGGLFVLTAKTYAEGASMFPEAGGSSSFARHAFDDVVSFFAGWALTLDYIITRASAGDRSRSRPCSEGSAPSARGVRSLRCTPTPARSASPG